MTVNVTARVQMFTSVKGDESCVLVFNADAMSDVNFIHPLSRVSFTLEYEMFNSLSAKNDFFRF